MEIQLALAGNSADTAKFKAELVAQGYLIATRGDDPDSANLAAYKTFADSTGKICAELQVSLDAGENVEYNVRAKINMHTPEEMTAYWFSVHAYNVTGKLRLVESLMAQLYGQTNR